MVKSSDTGGVKPMQIAGRLVRERERLAGMTEAERAFRKQWLQDQILAPSEPRHVPQIYELTNNPFRRLYKWPMNRVEAALAPIVGPDSAKVFRLVSTKVGFLVLGVYCVYYNYKYHGNEWDRKSGWRSYMAKSSNLPGDPGYPAASERAVGADYASRGFKDVTLNI